MKAGDYVDIKEARGPGQWKWRHNGQVRHGHVTEADKRCLTVRTDDGETIRDVREHFRKAK